MKLSLLTRSKHARSSSAKPERAKTGHCPHCGTAVEGSLDAYCCSGCELAATLIRGAGLEKYYEERSKFAPRSRTLEEGWEGIPV
ncbi:MAG: heavy metal translocating P-type ATPase metal-binding domain-containing protein, partial [Gemmatimonadota bacterium]